MPFHLIEEIITFTRIGGWEPSRHTQHSIFEWLSGKWYMSTESALLVNSEIVHWNGGEFVLAHSHLKNKALTSSFLYTHYLELERS